MGAHLLPAGEVEIELQRLCEVVRASIWSSSRSETPPLGLTQDCPCIQPL